MKRVLLQMQVLKSCSPRVLAVQAVPELRTLVLQCNDLRRAALYKALSGTHHDSWQTFHTGSSTSMLCEGSGNINIAYSGRAFAQDCVNVTHSWIW